MELRIVKAIALVALWMGMTVGLRAQTVVEYIHTDALGTPVAVTNAAGTVIERSVYEPYGQLINRPLTDGPGFTGHVQDAATGLTYMQQRYYDPMIGRFLSIDPVMADGNTGANFNRYWYANNNPYMFIDPDGRQALCGGSKAKRCTAVLDMDDLGTAPTSRNHQLQNGRSKTTDRSVPSPLPSPQVQSGNPFVAGTGGLTDMEALGDDLIPFFVNSPGGVGYKASGLLAVKLGAAGENAVRLGFQIGERGAFRIGAKMRFPDGMTATVLSEVKNVGRQSYTSQLRDYAAFAKSTGRRFDLYVRPNTILSGPLVDAIKAGDITLKFIP